VEWQGSAGWARPGTEPAGGSTRFDFASLTKPFVATLAIVLDAVRALSLKMPVGEVWPEANRKLARQPLESLLRHRSGMAAWTPLYHRCRSWREILRLLLHESLMGTRVGTYSDLDFLLWAASAERWLGIPLAELLQTHVLAPLGITGVSPAPGDRPGVAECFMHTGKEVELAAGQGMVIEVLPPPPVGLPQDGNARFIYTLGESFIGPGGGLAGNAGLFGRATDLWALAEEWLEPGKLLRREAVAAALAGGGPFALGWWRRTLRGGSGRALSPASFGHTGFAGGSVWIDPRKRQILVLLSHRTDPSNDMNAWRRRFHSIAISGESSDEHP
jgi:CubicO group peptidase (beta-lactamase class C family)